MWRLGFFFHEMAFGLLSVFLPLYIVSSTVHGSLLDIGILSATALFSAIPASFFWGYICDKTKHYKRYILISFLSSAVFLYLFSLTANVVMLIILYGIMSMFHMAHESPKNVLISELYSRENWKKTFAVYEGFTEIGWLFGLVLGFVMSAYSLTATSELLFCGMLNFIAFILSIFLVADPILIFERRLVSIENTIEFASRGISVASRMLDGFSTDVKLKRENLYAFAGGLILFSVATSMLFTPLPIFFSQEPLGLPLSIIFVVYALNSTGGILGYMFMSRNSAQEREKPSISRIVIFRGLLAFLLISALEAPAYNLVLAVTILVLMSFAYSFFMIYTLSISMELIPAGKAGLFNVLLGIGSASGSFIGPFLAQTTLGFAGVFIMTAFVFLLSYVSFKIFA
jgi:MFS family permease